MLRPRRRSGLILTMPPHWPCKVSVSLISGVTRRRSVFWRMPSGCSLGTRTCTKTSATCCASHEANNAEKAVSAYENAIKLMPNVARLRNELGHVYFDRKDYPRSIAAYRSAIDRDKKEPIFKTNLANALPLDGQQTEALALYREAATLAPDNADVRRTCCTGLYEMGRNDEAIEEGRAAVHGWPRPLRHRITSWASPCCARVGPLKRLKNSRRRFGCRPLTRFY